MLNYLIVLVGIRFTVAPSISVHKYPLAGLILRGWSGSVVEQKIMIRTNPPRWQKSNWVPILVSQNMIVFPDPSFEFPLRILTSSPRAQNNFTLIVKNQRSLTMTRRVNPNPPQVCTFGMWSLSPIDFLWEKVYTLGKDWDLANELYLTSARDSPNIKSNVHLSAHHA